MKKPSNKAFIGKWLIKSLLFAEWVYKLWGLCVSANNFPNVWNGDFLSKTIFLTWKTERLSLFIESGRKLWRFLCVPVCVYLGGGVTFKQFFYGFFFFGGGIFQDKDNPITDNHNKDKHNKDHHNINKHNKGIHSKDNNDKDNNEKDNNEKDNNEKDNHNKYNKDKENQK